MSDLRSPPDNLIQEDDRALREAGFGPRTARVLATLNWWAFPFTLIVTLGALFWIGLHLWPDLDATRWQAWANDNSGFFEPLRPGDTVAILPDLHSHSGLVVTRLPVGVRVERHLWFPFEEVPVGLVVNPESADRWLRLDYGDRDFWSRWHALAADPGIRLYLHLSQESASALGYEDFLARLRPAR